MVVLEPFSKELAVKIFKGEAAPVCWVQYRMRMGAVGTHRCLMKPAFNVRISQGLGGERQKLWW